MSKTFKTPKGTELPILNLRGKDYLQVMHRLVWFREERPLWGIETEFTSVTENSAVAKATIRDEQGRIVAQSHKAENAQGFGDFLEKSETGAIGRALALIGYGTQFCADELDEGERLADSPAAPRGPSLKAVPSADPGATTVPFEKSSQFGTRIDALSEKELRDMGNFLSKLKPPMKPETAQFKQDFEAYVALKFGVAR